MFFIITIRNYEDRETKRFSSLSYSIMNKGLYIGVYDKFVDRLIAVNYGNGNYMEGNPGGINDSLMISKKSFAWQC